MKRISFFLAVGLPLSALAQPEQHLRIAAVEKTQAVVAISQTSEQVVHFSEQELRHNPQFTHHLLVQTLYGQDVALIEKSLKIYQTFPQHDPILVAFSQAKIAALKQDYAQAVHHYRQILADNPNLNPVRVELAIALFTDKQDAAAEDQFLKAQAEPNLPEIVDQQINAYLQALKQRNEWHFGFSANYVRDQNVNNVAENRNIENTGYIKNEDMLPQTAHGIAFNLNIAKDFNVGGRNYLAFSNDLFGKSYWDNHAYDDFSNRTTLGYRYKTASTTFSLLPFYEWRWYGGSRYRWQSGGRLELTHHFNKNWQFSTALEGGKNRYFDATALNGNNKLASATLLWLRNPKQFFYLGADFNRETTQIKQYGSDTISLRLGWGQEWNGGISSRLNFSFSQRHYHDTAVLGGLLSLGKTRRDHIFNTYLTLWKRDWQIAGITPKLQLHYRKQISNLSTMYSYSTKNINVVVEKTF